MLGSNYDEIKAHNSELVGIYYSDLTDGSSLAPADVSHMMNGHAWSGGWRVQDAGLNIWYGGCYDACLFQGGSIFFVVDTATMTIYNYNTMGYEEVLAAIKQIDLENP